MGTETNSQQSLTLESARQLIGLSQLELDREAGLTKGTTFDLERGRIERPAHETVTRIVRALRRRGLVGVTSEALFPIPDDEPRKAVNS